MSSYPPFDAAPDAAEAATSLIRRWCGWHVAPVIRETLTLDGRGEKKLLLPSLRVVALHKVTIGGEEVDCEFSADGWIIRADRRCFPARERSVVVDLSHGFDGASELGQVVAGVVARARMAPTGNIVQQRAGSQAVTFASTGGEVAGFGLMSTEKAILNSYRVTGRI